MNERIRIAGGVVVLVLLIGGAVFLASPHKNGVAYRADDPGYNRTYWEQEVNQLGAERAYAEYKERSASLPFGKQHFSAHVIGAVIGEAKGADGVKVCDAIYGFGCYHGLFSDVIAKGGTALIQKLDQACVAAYGPLGTGCQHGIGHGILEYVGYDHLNEALALCKDTTQKVPLLGCSSGVFMEYFFPLTGPADALIPATRPFDPAHPAGPCASVPSENQASCYYELGGWARVSLGTVTDAGKSCGTLAGDARANCFMGAGTIAMQIDNNDPTKARAECAALPPSDELSCRAGIRWALFELPDRKSEAASGCGYSDPAKQKQCETLGDLTQGLDPR